MNRVIKLELSATRKKMLLINDLIPAATLLIIGLNSLNEGANTTLAFVNIVSGSLIIIYGLREWRLFAQHVQHKIQWYNVVFGVVMMLDSVMMYKPWKGFQIAYFYFAISLFYILMGFSVVKPISLFRRLTISATGFTLRTGPFSSLRCKWKEIKNIVLNGHVLHVTTVNGEREISLKKIENIDHVNSTLTSIAQMKLHECESNAKNN